MMLEMSLENSLAPLLCSTAEDGATGILNSCCRCILPSAIFLWFFFTDFLQASEFKSLAALCNRTQKGMLLK
jgi:hypothetical protein